MLTIRHIHVLRGPYIWARVPVIHLWVGARTVAGQLVRFSGRVRPGPAKVREG